MANHITIEYYKTAFGELILGSYEDKICLCDWRYRKMRETIDKRLQNGLKARYVQGVSDTLKQAKAELNAYFNKKLTVFSLNLLCVGTDFQKRVWSALQNIPYSQTRSYLQLAQILNDKKAIRAVASANGANAISIIIPCHRIIGNNGALIGYAGGIAAKQKLLELENQQVYSQLKLFQ